MTHEEFVVNLTKIFDNYAVSFEVDGRYSPKMYVELVEKLIKEAGYISPEEESERTKRDNEAMKIEMQEATQMQSEVEYWKNKNYELGGR